MPGGMNNFGYTFRTKRYLDNTISSRGMGTFRQDTG